MESAAIAVGNGHQLVGFLEDDPYISGVVRKALADEGFVPIQIEGGEDALRLAQDQGVTVFVLDIKIGKRSLGLDILEDLKQVNPNIWVCIYSGHVNREEHTLRARKAGADFIQVKTDEPRGDLLMILRELYLYRRELSSFAAALIDGLIKRNAGASSPVQYGLDSSPLGEGVTSQSVSRTVERGSIVPDENARLFKRLREEKEWRATYAGMAVAIVDGLVVCTGIALEQVLEIVRKEYPDKNRFVTLVEHDEEVFEVPTPFEVED